MTRLFRLLLVAASAAHPTSSGAATPATLADPEALRQAIPASAYDLSGFDAALLGAPVPAPGVHPRILFSPEDIPLLKRRLEENKAGQKALLETRFLLDQTLYHPGSDEGKIYAKLVAGDTADLTFLTPEPPKQIESLIFSSPPRHWFNGYTRSLPDTVHTAYLPNVLAASAFQALLDNDATRGRATAAAIANYYRLRNPFIAAFAEDQDRQQLAPKDDWRAIFGIAGGNNLAFCYDLAAPGMNEEPRDVLRHAIATARRDENQLGHPHLHHLPLAQAQIIVPSGEYLVSNGTWGNANFPCGHFFTGFFPGGKIAAAENLLMRQDRPDFAAFDPAHHQRSLEATVRKPAGKPLTKINWRKLTPLTPAHIMGPTPYDSADWRGADDFAEARASLDLPLDFADPVHGLFTRRSGSNADTRFLMFEARSNLFTISHQQHDAGHFYLAAHCGIWGVEAGAKSGYSHDHSNLRIDSCGLADAAYPPRVKFLGSAVTPAAAFATADITNA
ncbi:MAG: hypothetical protein RLZZ214_584 [Verrucomicrobiota bacterium]|jgi:hypothetical protein